MNKELKNYAVLGICIVLSFGILGYFLSDAIVEFKKLDRSVVVKGLSEKEVKADVVIWPIKFQLAGNDLDLLYKQIDGNNALIVKFLTEKGIEKSEITVTSPDIYDKLAQQYSSDNAAFRYSASSSIVVYSKNIDLVIKLQDEISKLGKKGIVFTNNDYDARTEFIFTGLNDLKPQMIQEATVSAREVATKFAQDSESKLGKIKSASQGQFTIDQRDKNNPHIKKVRVVATVVYYLTD